MIRPVKTLIRMAGLLLTLSLASLLAACGEAATPSANPPAATITDPTAGPLQTQPALVEAPVRVAAGSPAPDFTAGAVGGQTLRLSDFRGKAVILNYWAVY